VWVTVFLEGGGSSGISLISMLMDFEILMCCSYINPEIIIIIFSYNLWVSNKSIHQSKYRLLVTDTRDNIFISYVKSYIHN
jgi:hypothetical protein